MLLKLENFTGEIPRLPAQLLPDNAATEAVNCNFSHGELRSLQAPGPLKGTPQAVRSLFSDDGLRFFTWGKPTWARLGPTIDDTFGRVYFSNDDGFRVSQAGIMKPDTDSPSPPSQSWRVGLPCPGKPVVTAIDKASGTLGITLYREAGGAVVGPVEITNTEIIQPGREYLLSYQPDGGSGNSNTGNVETVDCVFVEGVRKYGDTTTGEGDYRLVGVGPYMSIEMECSVGPAIMGIGYFQEGIVVKALDVNAARSKWGNIKEANSGIPVTYIIKNGHEYTAETFYALLKAGKITSETGLDKASVLDGGTWLSTESKLTAKVQGDDWFAFSSGSIQVGGSSRVSVSLEKEGDGKVRVKISYGDKTSVAYTVTFSNQWNEESQASEPVLIDLDGFQVAQISVGYTGFPNGVPISGMNVYRTYANSDTYLLVNESPETSQSASAYVLVDNSVSPQTSTALVTAEWEHPHEDLKNIAYVGNGFLAGAVGKDLYFSEPYHPHAWPYAMTFPHAIVGMEAVEGGLLVTTLGKPYMVYGTHPEQMTQQMVDTDQAGVSDRSLTRVEGNAVFVSNDGLVTVSGGQASLSSSQNLFTRKDWRTRYRPLFHNMVLGSHDGAIVGLVDPEYPGAVQETDGFVIRLDEEGGSYTRLRLPVTPLGFSIVPEEDALYLGFPDGFAEFGAGDDLEFTWRSKDFTFSKPVTFGAVVIDCSPGITVSFYCNQVLVHTHRVGDGESSFRLPAVAPQKTWSVQFTGTGRLKKFEMASSFAELKNG